VFCDQLPNGLARCHPLAHHCREPGVPFGSRPITVARGINGCDHQTVSRDLLASARLQEWCPLVLTAAMS
jgi:hypothetical protein